MNHPNQKRLSVLVKNEPKCYETGRSRYDKHYNQTKYVRKVNYKDANHGHQSTTTTDDSRDSSSNGSSPGRRARQDRSNRWRDSCPPTDTATNKYLLKEIYQRTHKAIDIDVCFKIEELIKSGKLAMSDLDNRNLLKSLQLLDERDLPMLDKFVANSSSGKLNVEKLIDEADNWVRSRDSRATKDVEMSSPAAAAEMDCEDDHRNVKNNNHHKKEPQCKLGLDDAKLKKLLDEHGLVMDVVTDTDVYVKCKQLVDDCIEVKTVINPDDDDNGLVDLTQRFGKECMFNQVPSSVGVCEMLELFLSVGRIIEFHLFVNESTKNHRGYGYIFYENRRTCLLANAKLNKHEIRPGCMIEVRTAFPNNKVYVRNISHLVTKDELFKDFSQVLDGLKYVDRPTKCKLKEVDFCYLIFKDHQCAVAAISKLKHQPYTHYLGKELYVDWGHDFVEKPYNLVMIKNINDDIVDYMTLSKILIKYGRIDELSIQRQRVFVKYRDSIDAAVAKEELNYKVLNGVTINCVEIFEDPSLRTTFKRNNNNNNPHDDKENVRHPSDREHKRDVKSSSNEVGRFSSRQSSSSTSTSQSHLRHRDNNNNNNLKRKLNEHDENISNKRTNRSSGSTNSYSSSNRVKFSK